MPENAIAIMPLKTDSIRASCKNIRTINIPPNIYNIPILKIPLMALKVSRLFKKITINFSGDSDKIPNDLFSDKNIDIIDRNIKNDSRPLFQVIYDHVFLSEYDYVFVTLPTSIFLDSILIKSSFKKLKESSEFDAVMSVCEFPSSIERAMKISDNFVSFKNDNYHFKDSNNIEKSYFDAAQFYLIRRKILLNEKTLIPKKTFPVILDQLHCQDINTESDLKLALMKLNEISTLSKILS